MQTPPPSVLSSDRQCDAHHTHGTAITAWALFAALASHVLRDAPSGTAPLLWPLPSTSVPRWLPYGGELALLCSFAGPLGP